jgi:hypothetical protein
MGKKTIVGLAILILAICLISGGCNTTPEQKQHLESWKDLLKKATAVDQTGLDSEKPKTKIKSEEEKKEGSEFAEKTIVKLYFIDHTSNTLKVEERKIDKTEAIGRSTLGELMKGPQTTGLGPVFPEKTSLRDINLKPSGTCIIDLSGEATHVNNARDEKIMVYAMANTLGQFPE